MDSKQKIIFSAHGDFGRKFRHVRNLWIPKKKYFLSFYAEISGTSKCRQPAPPPHFTSLHFTTVATETVVRKNTKTCTNLWIPRKIIFPRVDFGRKFRISEKKLSHTYGGHRNSRQKKHKNVH
jgi:hypothetical protein